MAGLSGRLARIEARLEPLALTWWTDQVAGEAGLARDGLRAEVNALLHHLARLGPNPEPRAVARLVARRYQADEERVYRDLVARRKERRDR